MTECRAVPVDSDALWQSLADAVADDAILEELRGRPGLMAPAAVVISELVATEVAALVAALDQTFAVAGVRKAALELAEGGHLPDHGLSGGLLGIDLHLTADGPKVIEINTNPGGLLVVALQAAALKACRPELPPFDLGAVERAVLAVFRREAGNAPLRSVAIVDDDTAGQYLLPEFRLYRRLFEAAGVEASIVDGPDFRPGMAQLVYNRLVDFGLEAPEHAPLAAAWRAGETVVTPDPHAHALYSDKRVLALLCDGPALRRMGVAAAAARRVAAAVPKTVIIDESMGDVLWQTRRTRFFKPAKGHAGKAAYRGEKLSRGVWPGLLAGHYVAQDYVPVQRVGTPPLKMDLRAFAHAGRVILLAARLYEGQTTNFRTPGGGFAPVFTAG